MVQQVMPIEPTAIMGVNNTIALREKMHQIISSIKLMILATIIRAPDKRHRDTLLFKWVCFAIDGPNFTAVFPCPFFINVAFCVL
jgi:hypothetical protein